MPRETRRTLRDSPALKDVPHTAGLEGQCYPTAKGELRRAGKRHMLAFLSGKHPHSNAPTGHIDTPVVRG